MTRTLLFLPGNSPNLLMNGDVLGADALILDLEDAISPEQKDAARILVSGALKNKCFQGCRVIVRINAISSGLWQEDLEAVVPLGPDCIMPTKVNHTGDVGLISEYIESIEKRYGMAAGTVGLIPLIETALGVENAYAVANSPRAQAIFIGCEDLTADLGCERTKEGTEVGFSRSRVVLAARAAGIDAYDTPFTDIGDMEGLEKDARLARNLGFAGKACISPRHVALVNRIFSPTQEETDYARAVLQALQEAGEQGKGVISVNGKMVDKPILDRARRILEMEREIKEGRALI